MGDDSRQGRYGTALVAWVDRCHWYSRRSCSIHLSRHDDPGPADFIAAWAIIIGLLQLWGAIEFRRELEDAWLLVLNGVLSIAFGVILFVQPGAGAVALVWMIGWFAVVLGCLYIALAFRLKKLKQTA
jgi:hypothetical protein